MPLNLLQPACALVEIFLAVLPVLDELGHFDRSRAHIDVVANSASYTKILNKIAQ